MRSPLSGLPVPVIVVPESPRLIAARRHELEILPVCHLVLIDLKRRNVDRVSFVLIVPAKILSAPSETERRDTGGDRHHSLDDWGTWQVCVRLTRHLPYFHVERQLMEHVGQGFSMHQPMLNRDGKQSAQRKCVARLRVRVEKCFFKIRVESSADAAHVIADDVQRGPVRWQIGWKSAADWIDAEGEQPIKLRMGTLQPEDVSVQQIPIECLKVSYIEDDPVTLWNRSLIE